MKNLNYSLLAFLIFANSALASQAIVIQDAWIADAPPVTKTRAGYLSLHNTAKHPLQVHSFSSPDFTHVELHRTVLTNGMAKMEEIRDLTINSDQKIDFKPGSYHLMLFNPKRKLAVGDKVSIRVMLKDNISKSFTATVRKRGSGQNSNHKHHHH